MVVFKYAFLCVVLCACPRHPLSSPTPWPGGVHASVFVYMSTWLTRFLPSSLHSYVEMCASLCGPLCIPISVQWPSHKLHENVCFSVVLHKWPRYPSSHPKHWSEDAHASVYECMSTWVPISSLTPLHSFMQMCGLVLHGPKHWLEGGHAYLDAYMSKPMLCPTISPYCAPTCCGFMCRSHPPFCPTAWP